MNNPSGLASSYSPPFKIVMKYFIAAVFSFVLLNFLLALSYNQISGFHFVPRTAAITHIATLGWITMIIFGALFQLVPVVLEVKLFSERLAEIQFWIYLAGIAGLVYGFWFSDAGLIFVCSAGALNIAIILFTVNISASMIKVKKWNLTGYFIAAALFYLVVTGVAGLLLGINLYSPYIKIDHLQYLNLHAHVAFIGWVSLVIMGVSFKLIPMFSLSHGYSLTNGKWAFALINIGLLGINTVMHYPNLGIYYYLSAVLIVLGIGFYIAQILQIISKRVRKKFDIAMKFSILSFFMLVIVTLFGAVLTWSGALFFKSAATLYGYLIILGYISTLIVGQMYKIVPFLVWYHKYSSRVGVENVPMLKDLFDEYKAKAGFYLMAAGIVAAAVSFMIDNDIALLAGFLAVFASSIIFLINMITIFRR